MDATDIGALRGWIGRGDRGEDTITPGLLARFRATFGDDALPAGGVVPLALHWCLAPPAVQPGQIGPDGHPARGGFLPPVPLPRRMWAGGALEFLDPLRPGDSVARLSRIADVTEKTGRSGRLVFVTVEHEISTPRGIAVRERQDIVYRDATASGGGASQAPAAAPRRADLTLPVAATTVLLFRYSALTFNGHRIHYDRDYARGVEGYPGLVVHGPLQATLLANLAERAGAGRPVRRFEYRGVAPLFDGGSFSVNAARDGDGLELWCADAEGRATMSARAELGG